MQNEILDSHVEQYRLLKDISDVTDRKILQRISQGKFDREISQELFLSLQTIRNRVSRMLTESGARNRTHLAVLFTSEKAMDITSQSQAQDLNDSGNHDQVA
jgi:DNA-binding NarL/FixJ family response regulator